MKTTITLLLILFLAGCSCWHPDNRVRIKPEYSRVNHVDYDALRLAVMRELYCQRVLREYE